MEVYKKINQAILKIKGSDLGKAGRNTYSEYDYYTPEQVDKLVYEACSDLDLFIQFDLKRNQLGIEGHLTIIDLAGEESSPKAFFVMASDIPSIKATNISQQLGGAMTYTKRYMLMNVFDIVDNNLDFDNTNNTKKTQPKEDVPLKVLTQEEVKIWNGKIYGKNQVYISGSKYQVNDEQLAKLKALDKYIPNEKK